MLRIWGRLSSINVRKVVFAAQLLEIPFERIDAGREFGIVTTPDYLAKNPNALAPLIEDGEVTLWESNVIVRYLAAKHGAPALAADAAALPPEGAAPGLARPGAAANGRPGFYPQDLAQRFDAERWMDWQQTTLNNAGRDAFVQLIRVEPRRRNQALIDASVAATEPLMTMLDQHLARRPFMAGDSLGMADIPIACEIHRWWGLPLERPYRPHLERWYGGLLALPAARGALDVPLS